MGEEEIPMMLEILRAMDRITENAKDLRIWIAKEGIDLVVYEVER